LCGPGATFQASEELLALVAENERVEMTEGRGDVGIDNYMIQGPWLASL